MKRMSMSGENTFNGVFETFQAYNTGKNLSKATIKYYGVCGKSLVAFMGQDFDIKTFNQEALDRYKQWLRDRGNNDISVNSYLRGVRAVWNFFSQREYAPPLKVQLPKAEKAIKETYTDGELKALLKKPDLKKAGFDDYRNWVIINYLIGTGNRLSSIINIKIGDLNLDEGEVILRHTKNRKQQMIPLTGALRSILIEYMRYRKPKNEDEYLFCNAYGGQLTECGIKTAICRYNQRRGVKKTSIHLFRHTFAKKWIMNGGDILRLQKLLGHSSLDMVKEYVNLFGYDLKKDYERFNPLEIIVHGQYIKL